jgi:4-amino-4-deoxy-L-arabinose transferase-like glycosyltransferase
MDYSKVIWLKNVRPNQNWAYQSENDIQMMESRIFQLHWKSKDDPSLASPRKGDLMVLVQQAKVTHVVEVLDNRVYGNNDEWAAYRVVQAIWMPPMSIDWHSLPHQKEIFGIENLPQDGSAHSLDQADKMYQFNQYWKDKGGWKVFSKTWQKP